MSLDYHTMIQTIFHDFFSEVTEKNRNNFSKACMDNLKMSPVVCPEIPHNEDVKIFRKEFLLPTIQGIL